MASSNHASCILALEDGTVFVGTSFGATGTSRGEAVFNTSITGYQEILTDPSYCRQIVTMTAPQIGNYGINADDEESAHPQVAGFVVRELASRHSNHRATDCLGGYLREHGVIGIQGIDTRALTKRLRVKGTMRAAITTEESDYGRCVELARASAGMDGADLVSVVAPDATTEWTRGLFGDESTAPAPHRVVAIDCGMKRNILRHLVARTGPVTVVPPTLSAAEILDFRPAGIFVSNGPGDPSAVEGTISTLRGLIGRVPIFGICLGHQLLAIALGGTSYRLKFGHRGANQPVLNLGTGRVEITSQNHGFAIDPASLRKSGADVTHVNLNDETVEGFSHVEQRLLAVQYHPEASPGPHEAFYLFDDFAKMIRAEAPHADAKKAAGATTARRRKHSQESPIAR